MFIDMNLLILDRFTFQYGSTLIEYIKTYTFKTPFTFQYGSTLMGA